MWLRQIVIASGCCAILVLNRPEGERVGGKEILFKYSGVDFILFIM